MSYRNSSDILLEEIAQLRVELDRAQAAIVTSSEQCRAMRSRERGEPGEEVVPRLVTYEPAEDGAGDEGALEREIARLREALEQATAEARRLQDEERRLRAVPMRAPAPLLSPTALRVSLLILAIAVMAMLCLSYVGGLHLFGAGG
jgi:hypothetical protein